MLITLALFWLEFGAMAEPHCSSGQRLRPKSWKVLERFDYSIDFESFEKRESEVPEHMETSDSGER